MGILDKAKNIFGKAKDTVDEQVDKHSDKIPDKVEKAYDKASAAAEKIAPGKDGEPTPSEKLIKDD